MKKEYRNEDGVYHRVNGPAITWKDDYDTWCWNGKIHRYYGAACHYDELCEYYIFGEWVK